MQIVFNVTLPAQVKKKGKWYVSSCPILDVGSQGETKGKALQNLVEARGALDEVLKDSGFKPIEKGEYKVIPIPQKYERVNVPLPFSAPLRSHSTRTANCA
ncbi:MAG: type II toxin-antitoxin system HicB family antitoxin [Nitrospirae bacterium]|nr:type II toxin-antitoxin system HicB family antitoxin [Nitrospirota bacterium]